MANLLLFLLGIALVLDIWCWQRCIPTLRRIKRKMDRKRRHLRGHYTEIETWPMEFSLANEDEGKPWSLIKSEKYERHEDLDAWDIASDEAFANIEQMLDEATADTERRLNSRDGEGNEAIIEVENI